MNESWLQKCLASFPSTVFHSTSIYDLPISINSTYSIVFSYKQT